MQFAFAGDRDIAVRVLRFIREQGHHPRAMLLPDNASHATELLELLEDSSRAPILEGTMPAERAGELRMLDIDYIIAIHYPHIMPASILEVPRIGAVNLHPAYLPYNRGWHTPSWSILDETPAGATLHFMTEALDAGDIIHQKSLQIRPFDTAHTLYRRLKDLEYEVFVEAWPDLLRRQPPRTPQVDDEGTSHRRTDLAKVQRLDLDAPTTAREVLRTLRALTTDRLSEAAYFEEGEARHRVRIEISEEKD